MVMNCWRFQPILLLLLLLSGSIVRIEALSVGINYGQIANNLPSPTRVAFLLQSLNINRVKLYDADPNVLQAFSNTNVEFIVSAGDILSLSDPAKAQAWVKQHIQPFIPQTKISCIIVGNEILAPGADGQLMSSLLPAMQNMHSALVSMGLDKRINVTTSHSLTILANSFPPSSGAFRPDLAQYIQPILNFHSQVNSPVLINAYPYFAYKGSPNDVSLDYVLLQPNQGSVDPNTNLNYDNMLFAQIDAVYSAMKALGHSDIEVKISETGWPSKGDSDEPGATPENAEIYNGNLLHRVELKQGTPMKPSVPIDIFVFALFNENMKPGPTSERNYGLLYPNGKPVYNIGLIRATLPEMTISASTINVMNAFVYLICAMALLILA